MRLRQYCTREHKNPVLKDIYLTIGIENIMTFFTYLHNIVRKCIKVIITVVVIFLVITVLILARSWSVEYFVLRWIT